mmetsp:Transcript_94161/g.248840  ORF Transcript_94161/g.248840 Transcript_94161/m.248840 type:complete len:198 (+) Transcript_94161:46-639(+)
MASAAEEPSEEVVDFVLGARYGDLEDVLAYIKAGSVLIDAQSHGGATALLMGSANGHLEVVKALLEAKANLEVPNEAGNRPLHWAALNGHKQVCEALLEAKADANVKNEFGRKPFDEAFGRSLTEVCELLAVKTDFRGDPADGPEDEEAADEKGSKEMKFEPEARKEKKSASEEKKKQGRRLLRRRGDDGGAEGGAE